MKSRNNGFTLIELVVVIAILGILAASAIPRFADFTGDARKAAVEGLAGALSGGSNINYAAYLVRVGTGSTQVVRDTTAGCTNGVANSLLADGSTLPTTYTVSQTGLAPGAAQPPLTEGSTRSCTLTLAGTPTRTAVFSLVGAK